MASETSIKRQLKSPGELALAEVKAVEAIGMQFKRGRYVQQVGGTRTQPGGDAAGYLLGALEGFIGQTGELEDTLA